ncbi:MAG: hypothetical protein BMS9Abin05_1575 [Rhodothermia bacterium]|nr:MAG: hypothetical protein BMS9Abin05_1575 [Rhodothermia bacterium]
MRHIYLQTFSIALGMFIISVCAATTSSAQIAASEFSTISQTVDGTIISIEYSRPSRRGRDPLFGGVMAYGQIITPGANMATTIEFNRNVTIDGNAIPAGKYSVWIAFEEDQWEFALDETWQRFHGPHPVLNDLEFHFPVTPREVPSEMETLTFHFPTVRTDGTILRLHWGTTAVDMNIEVEPTPLVNVSADEAVKYVGTYRVEVQESPPWTMFSGTMDIELTYENGFLHSVMNIGPYTDPHDLAFFPKADQVFFPVMLMDGVIAQTFGGAVLFEFNMDSSGQAETFEARFPDDSLWLSGSRVE